jgi:hypothetical protein
MCRNVKHYFLGFCGSCAATSISFIAIVIFACSGCGSSSSIPARIVQGKVTCGDAPVEGGTVRFVPVEGTHGPMTFGIIDHGNYRVETHDGVPLGTHRVEVDAWKTTGRKVVTRGPFESSPTDEHEPMGPPAYSGENSPLRLQLTADSSDQFDIQLPAK